MNGLIALIVAAQAFTLADAPREQFTLSPEGNWQRVEKPDENPSSSPPVDAVADSTLDSVQTLIDRQQFGAARGRLVDWLRSNTSSPARDRALLMTASAFVGTDDRIRGFYYCDELMDTYPESVYYAAALQLQFEIADVYLNGQRDRLIGMPLLNRDDEAVEMLFRIQQRSPGSPLADKSLLRTADHYWKDGQFDLAADTYGFYAKTYPRSPLTPSVQVREAYSNLAQFKGPRYDLEPIVNARTQMSSIAATYPDLASAEEMGTKIEQADRQIARRMYLNADFYRRTGKPTAAAYLCKRLIAAYPSLPEAADAQKLLDRVAQ
jgi:outer membrane assembly lipoprotein YfiO